jgi:alanine racemase
MRAEAIVDLSAIKHNVELLKKAAGTKLLAVVKADAYGHGLIPVAQAALSAGADYLGVALLEEAIALREAGIDAPILAWLVQPGSDFKKAIELDIEIAVASLAALKEISDASTSKKAKVHLEVESSPTSLALMNRMRNRTLIRWLALIRWLHVCTNLDLPMSFATYRTLLRP